MPECNDEEANMNATATTVLSAQEQAIEGGKKVMHGTATDRVLRRCTWQTFTNKKRWMI